MTTVTLCNDWKKKRVKSSDIELLTANGRYSFISLQEERMFSDKSLSDWERELNNDKFVRIHKSYIINLDYIKAIGNSVTLQNGMDVPLARRRKKEFEEKYKNFLIEQE